MDFSTFHSATFAHLTLFFPILPYPLYPLPFHSATFVYLTLFFPKKSAVSVPSMLTFSITLQAAAKKLAKVNRNSKVGNLSHKLAKVNRNSKVRNLRAHKSSQASSLES